MHVSFNEFNWFRLLEMLKTHEKLARNVDLYYDDVRGRVNSKPDMSDPRLNLECSKCGSVQKVLIAYKKSNLTDCFDCRCFFCNNNFGHLRTSIGDKNLDDWIMPFGKHKGKKLSEIDRSYLKWCVENLNDSFKKPKRIFSEYLKSTH